MNKIAILITVWYSCGVPLILVQVWLCGLAWLSCGAKVITCISNYCIWIEYRQTYVVIQFGNYIPRCFCFSEKPTSSTTQNSATRDRITGVRTRARTKLAHFVLPIFPTVCNHVQSVNQRLRRHSWGRGCQHDFTSPELISPIVRNRILLKTYE